LYFSDRKESELGLGSGFSAFAFTMDFLQFLLHPPGTYPGKAWEFSTQALRMAHWSHLDFKKVGASPGKSGSCKKYQLAQMWMLYCFAQ
jgi:hypothetical protein